MSETCQTRKSPSARVTAAYPRSRHWVRERGTSFSCRKRNFGPYYKAAANKSQRPGRPFSSCDPRSENFRPAPATRSVTTLDTKTSLDCDCAITRAVQREPQDRCPSARGRAHRLYRVVHQNKHLTGEIEKFLHKWKCFGPRRRRMQFNLRFTAQYVDPMPGFKTA